MTTKNFIRGYSAESYVDYFLHESAITPHTPQGNYCSYDRLILVDEVPIRIQIKCASKLGRFDVRTTRARKHKQQPRFDYDVLAVVDLDRKEVYFIPTTVIKENKQKGCRNIRTQQLRRWKDNLTAIPIAVQTVRNNLCNEHNSYGNIAHDSTNTNGIYNDDWNNNGYNFIDISEEQNK
jgi:hypothetical protein